MAAPDHCRFPIGFTLLTLICLPILIGLGVWQVQRLHWKEALLARIAAARTATPRPVDEALARGGDPSFQRVTATCAGLASAPYVELAAIADGEPGVRLISLCRRAGGGPAVLVDRGFVAETISARPPETGATAPATVTGVLRRGEAGNAFTPPARGRRFHRRNEAGMARALGAPAGGAVFLVAETSSNTEWRALRPMPLPERISNNHLGYALTWFGLAVALTAFWTAFLLRWRRARRNG